VSAALRPHQQTPDMLILDMWLRVWGKREENTRLAYVLGWSFDGDEAADLRYDIFNLLSHFYLHTSCICVVGT
jgi:hypothetical protein